MFLSQLDFLKSTGPTNHGLLSSKVACCGSVDKAASRSQILPTLAGGHHAAYLHFVVPLLLLLLWSWRSLAGCSAAAPTGRTGVPEPGLEPGEHWCSGWLLCQVYGESWAGLQIQGHNHHWGQGQEEEEEEEGKKHE